MRSKTGITMAAAVGIAAPLALAPVAAADWVAGGDFKTGSNCTLRYSLQREANAIWGSSVKVGTCSSFDKHQVLVLPPNSSWVFGAETTATYADTAYIPRVAGTNQRWRVCVYASNQISPNQQCTGAAGTPADYLDNYGVTPPPPPAK